MNQCKENPGDFIPRYLFLTFRSNNLNFRHELIQKRNLLDEKVVGFYFVIEISVCYWFK